ncbi:MAG TPA: hypothetical protein VN770_01325 [Gaiellaceae bacterium]|nr:hypothetical protein [Gaiellaceae bacterium]
MATQTRNHVMEGPLDVVLRPGSEAAAAYRSAVLAPGFGPEPSLDLRYFGGRTLSHVRWTHVYLGTWDAHERAELDHALSAAMRDSGLNNVLAQYFPSAPVTAAFAGQQLHAGAVPGRVYRDTVETLVAGLSTGPAVACVLLPRGTVLVDGDSHGGHAIRERDAEAVDSKHGLGGYHGSIHVGGSVRYYAVSVYSEGDNGIVAFDEPWKNVCATLYHELQETRTDPDVEDAIRLGTSPGSDQLLGWYSPRGGEIGDIPMSEAGAQLDLVMKEIELADGTGTVPVQLMWSNAVGGPEGPTATPRRPR